MAAVLKEFGKLHFFWESVQDDFAGDRIDMPPTWPSLTGENLIAAAVLDVLKPGPYKKHVKIHISIYK